MDLQQVPGHARRDHLATTSEVDERDDQATVVDHQPGDPVRQHDPAIGLVDDDVVANRGDLLGRSQRWNALPDMGCGVEDHSLGGVGRDLRIGGAAGQQLQAGTDQVLEIGRQLRVVLLGDPVHPGDRGPGQDVVELLQKHCPPVLLEPVVRVFGAESNRCGGRPQFGLPQQVFAAAVALLGAGLRGVRAPVQLQVHLPHPGRGVRVVGLGSREEVRRAAELHRRRTLQGPGASAAGDHLPGRTAAAVAVPVRHQAHGAAAVVGVVPFGVVQLRGHQLRVVGVDRREMGEHPGAVDALPPEGVVWHAVGLVPGDLLGEEVAGAGGRDDLRERGRVAERVRQPHLGALHPELLEEEALPGHELPRHRLAAGHVGIGFDPHAADRDELTAGDLGPDPFEEFGVVVPDPGELLGRRAGEDEPGVLVHQSHHRGERPGALADRLAHRPQPRGVDVRMTDGVQVVGAGRRR